MLLYALNTRKQFRTWVLDLTAPPQSPADLASPSVYALVVPAAPMQIYIGSTRNLRARLRQHITRSRAELGQGRRGRRLARTSSAAVLKRVLSGRSALLVLRLEAVPRGNEALLRRLELARLIVAAREELPVQKRRGPRIVWPGDPGELRLAFRLARKRRWPGLWVQALKPLCENRALPDPPPGRPRPVAKPSMPGAQKRHRGRPPKPHSPRRSPVAKGESLP